MSNTPYREEPVETIDTLKATIARLEKEKKDLTERRSRKERWFQRAGAVKHLFVEPYAGLRVWVGITLSIGVVFGLIVALVSCLHGLDERAKEHIKQYTPAPISCGKIGSRRVCITADYELLYCKSSGCFRPTTTKPKDL